jgi:hypothetical protein
MNALITITTALRDMTASLAANSASSDSARDTAMDVIASVSTSEGWTDASLETGGVARAIIINAVSELTGKDRADIKGSELTKYVTPALPLVRGQLPAIRAAAEAEATHQREVWPTKEFKRDNVMSKVVKMLKKPENSTVEMATAAARFEYTTDKAKADAKASPDSVEGLREFFTKKCGTKPMTAAFTPASIALVMSAVAGLEQNPTAPAEPEVLATVDAAPAEPVDMVALLASLEGVDPVAKGEAIRAALMVG